LIQSHGRDLSPSFGIRQAQVQARARRDTREPVCGLKRVRPERPDGHKLPQNLALFRLFSGKLDLEGIRGPPPGSRHTSDFTNIPIKPRIQRLRDKPRVRQPRAAVAVEGLIGQNLAVAERIPTLQGRVPVTGIRHSIGVSQQ